MRGGGFIVTTGHRGGAGALVAETMRKDASVDAASADLDLRLLVCAFACRNVRVCVVYAGLLRFAAAHNNCLHYRICLQLSACRYLQLKQLMQLTRAAPNHRLRTCPCLCLCPLPLPFARICLPVPCVPNGLPWLCSAPSPRFLHARAA